MAYLTAFAVFVCAGLPTAEGGALRGPQAPSADDPLAPLGRALTESRGTVEVEERLLYLAEAMRPAFLALPRSPEGCLEASAVRYLLHRYFIDRDGWFVQGSDAAGESADNSLPKTVLQGGALADALSKRLAERGLTLREVAVLAMGLETLARKETEDRLHAAYHFMNLSHREDATESELHLALQAYMVMFSGGYDHEVMTWAELEEAWKGIQETEPHWDELQIWFSQVRSEVLASIPPRQRFTFDSQVRVLEEVQHRFGRWQNEKECLSIKRELLKYASPGTGRVRLNAFYAAELPGGWTPSETKEYLREIGALDETDPKHPSVVVPNYFEAPSNCENSSKYYSVCCISECEALLGDLERKLGSPNAPPQQIVQIVENLSSATVEAPRRLPAQLVQRLESVAELHGGHAPLHGRLFRQWMHHAFPAECSVPALSMTKKLRSPEEFFQQTGHTALLSPEIMGVYAKAYAQVKRTTPQPVVFEVDASASSQFAEGVEDTQELQELPWSEEEELFVVCRSEDRADGPASAEPRKPSRGAWRDLILLVLAVAMASMLVQTVTSAKRCVLPVQDKLSMV